MAAWGLGWGLWDLVLWHTDLLVVVCGLHCSMARGILVSPTRDGIYIPCIAGRILNHWTTREVLLVSFNTSTFSSDSVIKYLYEQEILNTSVKGVVTFEMRLIK